MTSQDNSEADPLSYLSYFMDVLKTERDEGRFRGALETYQVIAEEARSIARKRLLSEEQADAVRARANALVESARRREAANHVRESLARLKQSANQPGAFSYAESAGRDAVSWAGTLGMPKQYADALQGCVAELLDKPRRRQSAMRMRDALGQAGRYAATGDVAGAQLYGQDAVTAARSMGMPDKYVDAIQSRARELNKLAEARAAGSAYQR